MFILPDTPLYITELRMSENVSAWPIKSDEGQQNETVGSVSGMSFEKMVWQFLEIDLFAFLLKARHEAER